MDKNNNSLQQSLHSCSIYYYYYFLFNWRKNQNFIIFIIHLCLMTTTASIIYLHTNKKKTSGIQTNMCESFPKQVAQSSLPSSSSSSKRIHYKKSLLIDMTKA